MKSTQHNAMLSAKLHILTGKIVSLKNRTCVYCGKGLSSKKDRTREHVIAERFVPSGKLRGEWNLILNACKECNLKKSNLEDDISAISLLPDMHGRYSYDDDTAISEARRKSAGSFSRRTKKIVAQSIENFEFKFSLGPGVDLTFNLVGPPQIDHHRAAELAYMQLMGFFYYITYDPIKQTGFYWPGSFSLVNLALKSNWGNEQQKAFAQEVLHWDMRILGGTAQGFFKVAIRKHPSEICWAWALEWNCNIRLVGFFGDECVLKNMIEKLPVPKLRRIQSSERLLTSHGFDKSLLENEDFLFQ